MGILKNLFGNKDTASLEPLAKAEKLEKAGRLNETISIYIQYLKDKLGAIDTYELLANAYGKNGQWEKGKKVAIFFEKDFSFSKQDWAHHLIMEAQERIYHPEGIPKRKRDDDSPKIVKLAEDGSVNMNGEILKGRHPAKKKRC